MNFKVWILFFTLINIVSCGVKSPPKYDKSKPLPSIESKYINTDTQDNDTKKSQEDSQ